MSNVCMWEIFVPTTRPADRDKLGNKFIPKKHGPGNQPTYFKTRYHRVWDEKVREITGGLTIMPPSLGQWVSPDKVLFIERMIPVRIMATREQIDKVIQLTLDYYMQEAILCYKISNEVILQYADDKKG